MDTHLQSRANPLRSDINLFSMCKSTPHLFRMEGWICFMAKFTIQLSSDNDMNVFRFV